MLPFSFVLAWPIPQPSRAPPVSPSCLLHRRSLFSLAALAPLSLGACTSDSDQPLLPDPRTDAYLLGSGDQVRISVFGQDQLSDVYRVDEGGAIAFPLIGAVKAAGVKTAELGELITSQLRGRQLLANASVTVMMISFRPIFVIGEVVRPGQYPYQPGMTLLTAVAVAGGFTYRAVRDHALAVRVLGDKPTRGRVERESLIAPGDVIEVRERFF